MKGKVVRYRDDVLGIVLDYKKGYRLRDSITGRVRFITEPLCRIYWLKSPHPGIPLLSAPEEIIFDLDIDEKLSFGFNTSLNNVEFIEELDVALNHEEWYFAKHFVVL